MIQNQSYQKLLDHFKKTALLESAYNLGEWDQDTYMPPKGAETRAEVMALLTGMMHERVCDPHVAEWLTACEGTELTKEPLSIEAVNIREWRKQHDKAIKVPKSLAEEITRTSVLAKQDWVEARKKDDFKIFEPKLARLIGLLKQKAQCFGLSKPYDALIDSFEPGITSAQITAIFSQLKTELVPLMERIVSTKKYADDHVCHQIYPVEIQKQTALQVIERMGFDFNAGRVDVTVHPFCTTIGANDARITARYNPERFNDAFFGLMHETGHALYEQGLPEEHFGTPRGRSISLGIHESQSLFWENMIGRSRGFWQFFYPIIQKAYPQNLSTISWEGFYQAINVVKPSFIRVEADEVTYPFHVILRYEIEQGIFSNDIQAKDIPAIWNEQFKKLLGIAVPSDKLGCLQDIHWSLGVYGYFPTYLLGKLYAACFHEQAERDLGGLDDLCGRGELSTILQWLRKNIHQTGMTYSATDLCQKVCGKPLSPEPLMAYLRKKFLD